MFNCCSHGTLLHFGLQSSRLNICYYHQDLHLRRLHPGPRPRLQGSPQRPSYSSRRSVRGGTEVQPAQSPMRGLPLRNKGKDRCWVGMQQRKSHSTETLEENSTVQPDCGCHPSGNHCHQGRSRFSILLSQGDPHSTSRVRRKPSGDPQAPGSLRGPLKFLG